MATKKKEAQIDDLQQQIEMVCIERGLEPSEVLKAIEQAIASAYRKEFGVKEKAYEAEFDKISRTYTIYEVQTIVNEVENPEREIDLLEAKLNDPNAEEGDKIRKKLEIEQGIHFSRVASQVAKQVITQSINNTKHTKVLQRFKEKVGEIVTVEVDYYRRGGYSVKLAETTGYLARENLSPLDRFKSGQLVKALIKDIYQDDRGNLRVQLDRASDEFVIAILNNEVPEVESGIVKIEKIVREVGGRTKILVSASEGENIDPVGTILGRKNVRLTNIIREISPSMQERLDVIEYQPNDLETMIFDALEPAEIESVDLDKEKGEAIVYCYPEEAALAVGRRGVNIRLAGKLLDLEIKIEKLEDDEGQDQDSYSDTGVSISVE